MLIQVFGIEECVPLESESSVNESSPHVAESLSQSLQWERGLGEGRRDVRYEKHNDDTSYTLHTHCVHTAYILRTNVGSHGHGK